MARYKWPGAAPSRPPSLSERPHAMLLLLPSQPRSPRYSARCARAPASAAPRGPAAAGGRHRLPPCRVRRGRGHDPPAPLPRLAAGAQLVHLRRRQRARGTAGWRRPSAPRMRAVAVPGDLRRRARARRSLELRRRPGVLGWQAGTHPLRAQGCRSVLLPFLLMTRYPHGLPLPRVWVLRHDLFHSPGASCACRRGRSRVNRSGWVALAEALGAPLVTRDRRLANAPGHQARVELA